jgi:hypothetical protein
MEFEWNEKKSVANRKKHGISFHEAATVFGDPLAITFPDPQPPDYFLIVDERIPEFLVLTEDLFELRLIDDSG